MHLLAYSESSVIGGAEISLATLLSGIDASIELTVVGTNPEVAARIGAARPGARTRVIRYVEGMRDLSGIADHLRLVRELRPDILQVNCGSPWEGQYALLAGNLTRGVKTLAVQHAATPPYSNGQRRRQAFNLRRTDALVCVSAHGARTIERWSGLAEGTIRVIPTGVPDEQVEPIARPVSGPIIGTVGRLEPEKGLDVLLRALTALPDVTAILVGEGRERESLGRMASELGIGERVLMPGWRADPRPWLSTFDVFVMPSRTESQGIAALEAMVASRPVVASRVDGVPEVVIDGSTGLLIPPEDPDSLARAVRSLLEDPDRRAAMGEAGRRIARERFTVDRMTEAYASLYGVLLGGRMP